MQGSQGLVGSYLFGNNDQAYDMDEWHTDPLSHGAALSGQSHATSMMQDVFHSAGLQSQVTSRTDSSDQSRNAALIQVLQQQVALRQRQEHFDALMQLEQLKLQQEYLALTTDIPSEPPYHTTGLLSHNNSDALPSLLHSQPQAISNGGASIGGNSASNFSLNSASNLSPSSANNCFSPSNHGFNAASMLSQQSLLSQQSNNNALNLHPAAGSNNLNASNYSSAALMSVSDFDSGSHLPTSLQLQPGSSSHLPALSVDSLEMALEFLALREQEEQMKAVSRSFSALQQQQQQQQQQLQQQLQQTQSLHMLSEAPSRPPYLKQPSGLLVQPQQDRNQDSQHRQRHWQQQQHQQQLQQQHQHQQQLQKQQQFQQQLLQQQQKLQAAKLHQQQLLQQQQQHQQLLQQAAAAAVAQTSAAAGGAAPAAALTAAADAAPGAQPTSSAGTGATSSTTTSFRGSAVSCKAPFWADADWHPKKSMRAGTGGTGVFLPGSCMSAPLPSVSAPRKPPASAESGTSEALGASSSSVTPCGMSEVVGGASAQSTASRASAGGMHESSMLANDSSAGSLNFSSALSCVTTLSPTGGLPPIIDGADFRSKDCNMPTGW